MSPKQYLASLTAGLDRYGRKSFTATDISIKLGVNSGLVIALFGILAASLLLLVGGLGAIFVLIGIVCPALKSFKAIETETLEDDKYWLKYWMCFGCL